MNDKSGDELSDRNSTSEKSNGGNIESDYGPLDRPRGILSKADREYLCGQKEYAHAQSESNRKQDIRNRVQNSLRDFRILSQLLDQSEIENIVEELGTEETYDSIVHLIAFSYLCSDQDRPRIEGLIQRGVRLGANIDQSDRSAGKATDVDVTINIEYEPDIDVLYEMVQSRDTSRLTASDIGALVRAGKLDSEDLERLEGTEAWPSV